jgi:hypothetical protein
MLSPRLRFLHPPRLSPPLCEYKTPGNYPSVVLPLSQRVLERVVAFPGTTRCALQVRGGVDKALKLCYTVHNNARCV